MPRGIQPRRSAQRCLVVSAYHFTCAAARSAQASNLQVLGKLMTPRPRCFLGDKRGLISILWLFRCTNSWNTFGSSHHNKNSVSTCSWRAWALGKTSPMKESFLIRTKVAKETALEARSILTMVMNLPPRKTWERWDVSARCGTYQHQAPRQRWVRPNGRRPPGCLRVAVEVRGRCRKVARMTSTATMAAWFFWNWKWCMRVSKNRGTPKWMVYKENPIIMDDLGVPLFSETSV